MTMDQQKQIRITRLLHEFLRDEQVTAEDFVARQPEANRAEAQESVAVVEALVRHNMAPSPSEEGKRKAVRALKQRKRERNLAKLREWANRIIFQNVEQYANELVGAKLALNRSMESPSSPAPDWQREASNQRLWDAQARGAAGNILAEINNYQLPVDPQFIAERLGILVEEFPLDNRDGCVFRKDDLVVILLNSNLKNDNPNQARRKRFTCAHEIGHSVLHAGVALFEDDAEALRDFHTLYERQAHVFASNLLAPVNSVRPLLDGHPSLSQGDAIQNKFDLSLAASLIRVVTDSDWDCALVTSHKGRVQWAFMGEHFPGFIPRGKLLPASSVAKSLEDKGVVGTAKATIQPAEWLSDGSWIFEESRRTQSGWTYSLLRPTSST